MGSGPVDIVAKQFLSFSGEVWVLGYSCEQVSVRTASCSVWRAAAALTVHSMAYVKARRTWAPLLGSDMIVMKSGV